MTVKLPDAFGRVVADAVPSILAHQREDGAIVYDPAAPIVYPQQAVLPLAFCWAGLDPDKRHAKAPQIRSATEKLGAYLVRTIDDKGRFHYDSYGHDVFGVDQRLAYAWVEAIRILREAGGDFDFERWADKIVRGCETLLDEKLRKLAGVRRFVGRVLGTSTNHVALYLALLYRAGSVLGRREFVEVALPIARALAEDVHPDGYWEEHSDLLRSGGPTPSYNYLTHCGIALFYEWTGEAVFRDAIARSTAFHGNFSYPDGTFFDLIDERVRYGRDPRIWGLFGFSRTPEGRGMAARKFSGWLERADPAEAPPEALARHCENCLYWHEGETAPAPFERPGHSARLSLPAAIFRRGAWCVGLSCMRATNAEDPAYRDNPFALERQKLFSVWHERTGLLLDGSHSKFQPENSTFHAPAAYAADYWPCGGTVGEEDGDLVARAAYKTFFGTVRVRTPDARTLAVELSVDPACSRGPFTAGFTLRPQEDRVATLSGTVRRLGPEPFRLCRADMGGGFRHGPLTLEGSGDFQLAWPLSPFNSYAADRKSPPGASLLHVSAQLTPERPRSAFTLTMSP